MIPGFARGHANRRWWGRGRAPNNERGADQAWGHMPFVVVRAAVHRCGDLLRLAVAARCQRLAGRACASELCQIEPNYPHQSSEVVPISFYLSLPPSSLTVTCCVSQLQPCACGTSCDSTYPGSERSTCPCHGADPQPFSTNCSHSSHRRSWWCGVDGCRGVSCPDPCAVARCKCCDVAGRKCGVA
jgi:hypothetical protein